MAARQNKVLDLEDINVKVAIAYGIALVILILLYIAFFK